MTADNPAPPALVLASSSRYRRDLLQRLRVDFYCQSPAVDESPRDKESPLQLVQRLAEAKATAVAGTCEQPALVIGSDQVAVLDDALLGKPGDLATARRQLQLQRGRRIEFLTGLCVVNTRTGNRQVDVVPFSVQFRRYTDAELERYLSMEQPLDCAGSFRSEALGISLVEAMTGSDPSALIGLPLIRLAEMLRREGLQLP